MTCKPLTDDHGAALLTSWLADSRAKTSAWLGGGLALTANAAECGTTWPASLAKYDPASHSLKTAQLSLIEDLTGCSLTLPRSGLMQGGECYPQPMWAPITSESASGFWQTPVADDCVNREKGKINSRGEPKLSAQVLRWTTPSASDATRGGTITDAMTGTSLAQPINTPAKWPTPTASDHSGAGHAAQGGLNLRTAVAMYPTPRAMDCKGSPNPESAAKVVARGHTPNLTEYVAQISAHMMWPTATATAYKGWSPNHNRSDTDDRLDYTVERQGFQPGQQTPPVRLNPNWVEWLMGWPIGQTELKPLATAKYQEWQQQHSPF
jgi:hypothetical protein